MKRLSLLVLALLMIGGVAGAQRPSFRDGAAFTRGDLILNLGIGLGNSVYDGSYTKKIPPISLSGEYGVAGDLFNNGRGSVGVGLYLGYTGAKYRAFDNLDAGWRYHNLIIGARGSLHYQFANRLDTYLGLLLGYDISMTNEFGNFPTSNRPHAPAIGGFQFAFYAGTRYLISDHFGLFAELGYGTSILNLGLVYKF